MNKIIKRIVSAVIAVAITLTAVFMLDVPEMIASAAAEGEGTHSHMVCVGSGHDGCSHEAIEFEPFPEFNDGTKQPIFRAKSYYLTKDIVLEDEGRIFIQKGVTNLCLNGHSITKNGDCIIDVNEIDCKYTELNICDCKGNGMIKNTSADNAGHCISVLDASALNLYSGTVDGGAAGSGIALEMMTTDSTASTANIYGGKVRANGIAIYTQGHDTSLNVYGGEISSSEYYTIYVEGERSAVSVYGGKITGSGANPYSTVMIMGDGACFDIKGGEVAGENYSALYCHTNSTLRISDGVVKSESTANTCIHNIGTLIVSGGKVSGGGKYGIRNYCGSAKATINGGTISCKGTGASIYNYNNGVLEISGGEITSESGNGISNRSALTVSGGTVSGNIALRNYDNGATATISGGQLSCKGDFGIWNYNGGALNITDGKVSGGKYCLYNQEGTITISGGVVSAKSNYALYNEEKGTAVINGGTLNSTFSPVTNLGTLNISGGIFGAEDPATLTYMINQKNMNLSGSPVFINSSVWLKTDDNIGITGELGMSEPCTVYIASYVPRIFTSGWSTHMQGQKPSDYFKSPYADAKIIYRDNEAAMVYYYKITYDANGGSCSVQSAETDVSGKLASLAVPKPQKDGYNFDGWFTEETGGEQVTADTVFTDDTTIYAHWTCNDHIWGDTYEKDEDHHWKTCTRCGTESDKTAHQWDNGTVTKQPSESETGLKTYTCNICDAEKTEELEMLAHTHTYSNEWTSDESGHWHSCSGCAEKLDFSAHTEDSGTITLQPTETTEGTKTFKCTVCGYVMRTETIPATGTVHVHDFGTAWKYDTANHWHECDCGEKKDNAAHTWNSGEITKRPTASTKGEKTFECTVCGKTRTETIPATGGSGGSGRPSRPSHPQPDNGSITEEIQPGENAPGTKITTPLDELADIVLTSSEKAEVNDGTDITIILKIEDGTHLVPGSDKTKVETVIGGMRDYKLGQYLDVNLLKIIGDIQENIHETNAPITVMFEIPEALRGEGREYAVIRVHDGETTILPDLDDDEKTVTIRTDKFSTYALAYSEKTDSNTSDESSEPSTDSSDPTSEGSEPADSGETSSGSGEGSSDSSTTSPSGESSSTGENSGESGTSPSTDENNSVPSESTPSGNTENPATGIAVSLIPLTLALAAMTAVTVKRKKK